VELTWSIASCVKVTPSVERSTLKPVSSEELSAHVRLICVFETAVALTTTLTLPDCPSFCFRSAETFCLPPVCAPTRGAQGQIGEEEFKFSSYHLCPHAPLFISRRRCCRTHVPPPAFMQSPFHQ
jgi:hypothetical protein